MVLLKRVQLTMSRAVRNTARARVQARRESICATLYAAALFVMIQRNLPKVSVIHLLPLWLQAC